MEKSDSCWSKYYLYSRKKYRYSFRKQVSDQDALDIVKLNYQLVKEEIFGTTKPDIIILPNFGSLFHNILYHFAKVNNVKCWTPTASKISNRVILSDLIDYCLNHIFHDFNNFKPNQRSIEFSKNI